MTARPLDLRGAALAFLIHVIWAGNPVAIKIAVADCPPLRLAWMRFLLGGVAVLAWARATGQRNVFRIRPGEARLLLTAGLLFALQVGTMNVGIAHTTAANAVVLFNAYAVHAVVLSHFQIPGDRLTPSKLAGIVVAYLGVVLLFAGTLSLSSDTLGGDLLVSASALLLGERTAYTARAIQRLDPTTFLVYQALVGITCFVLVSLWWEAPTPTRYTASFLLSLGFQGLVVAGFNFAVNLALLRVYRPSALAAWGLVTPVAGVVIAAVVSGEPLTPTLWVSSALVAAGIGLATRR
jgi:drug/metabolite transporter (DMT)-like permease